MYTLRCTARLRARQRTGPAARRLCSARHEFPDAWHRFLHPQPEAAQTLELSLGPERFPYLLRGRAIHVTRVDLYLKPQEEEQPAMPAATLELPSHLTPQSMTVGPDGVIPLAHALIANLGEGTGGTWTLRVDVPGPPVLTPAKSRDFIVALTYHAT